MKTAKQFSRTESMVVPSTAAYPEMQNRASAGRHCPSTIDESNYHGRRRSAKKIQGCLYEIRESPFLYQPEASEGLYPHRAHDACAKYSSDAVIRSMTSSCRVPF